MALFIEIVPLGIIMKGPVIGSPGVRGRNVVPRLVENRHEVRALVRREPAIANFGQLKKD